MLRRGLALGAGLLVLILLVLGVRGCLNARKERALSDYANNVTQIVEETAQASQSFFGKLSEPGELSVTDFVDEVNADRAAVDSFNARIDGLDTPGDMDGPQGTLEMVYQLRANAMGRIADRMSTALGDVGSERAKTVIARQMKVLVASDVLYNNLVRPEINSILTENGLEGDAVPASTFVPEGAVWLDEANVVSALGSVSGTSGTATSGVHGLGLWATLIGGTELSSEGTTSVSSEAPEVEVQVQNQGESTENGVAVSVSVDGGNTLQGTIPSIAAGETEAVTIPLTPAPKGTVSLEVEVATVPGEKVADNNKATYSVAFE